MEVIDISKSTLMHSLGDNKKLKYSQHQTEILNYSHITDAYISVDTTSIVLCVCLNMALDGQSGCVPFRQLYCMTVCFPLNNTKLA